MRSEGGIQRRPIFYEGAGGTAGKVYRVYEGRKEGRKEGRSYTVTRQGVAWKATRTEWAGAGVFCLSNIKELVANFLPSPSRPPLVQDHTRLCFVYPRTRVYTQRVPARSSGVPGDGFRAPKNGECREWQWVAAAVAATAAKRVNVVGCRSGFWWMHNGGGGIK